MSGRMVGLLRNFLRRSAVEQALDDELNSALEFLTQEKIEQGLSRPEARRQARIELGGIEQVKGDVRAVRLGNSLETLVRDLRLAFRALAKSPGFAVVAVATIAFGVGANSAIFAIANSLLFRPLPFHHPDRLVSVFNQQYRSGDHVQSSWADLDALRSQTDLFESVGNYLSSANSWIPATDAGGASARVTNVAVSPGFFPALGVQPLSGRLFSTEEYHAPEPAEGRQRTLPVVLSYGLWQTRFAGRPDVLGRTFTLDDDHAVVVGVMPRDFRFLRSNQHEIFAPLSAPDPKDWHWRWRFWDVIARLKPGVELAQAQARMKVFSARREREDPAENRGIRTQIEDLHEYLFGSYRKPFPLLFGTAGLLLLVTCASVANLLLSRAAVREREIALRFALGASRWRVARQLLVENGVIAVCGGAAGVLLSFWCLRLFYAFSAAADMGLPRAQLDGYVIGFALLLTVLTGIVFGLAPACHFARHRDSTGLVLKGAAGAFSRGASAQRLSGLLITAEVALSLALLVGVGLLLKTLLRLDAVSPGFVTDRALLMDIGKIPYVNSQSDFQKRSMFWPQFLDRVEALPGIQAAAFSDNFPTSTQNEGAQLYPITLEGDNLPPPGYLIAEFQEVTAGYFPAMGIPLLAGRVFTNELRTTRLYSVLPEVLIGERLAKEQWPNQDPIGRRIVGPHNIHLTVIGVVGDVKQHGLRAEVPQRMIYVPLRYWDFSNYETQFLIVKTSDTPEMAVAKVQAALRNLDLQRSVLRVRTMKELVRKNTAWDRLKATIVALFGALALLLTLLGVYGTVARTVSARTRDIGIRLALGSRPGWVIRMVMRQGVEAALAGLLLGWATAWLGARLLSSQLFEVSPADPLIFACASLLLLGATLAACYVPARRAAGLDPVAALRCE